MTDRAEKKLGYDEREKRMVEEFAMKVFLDPQSTEEDRNKAKARLMNGGGQMTTVTLDGLNLPSTVLTEWLWANAVILYDRRSHDRKPVRCLETPTPQEKFINAMTLAQERWTELVAALGQERALQLAHAEWCLLEGKAHPIDPIWTFCEPPALSAQERLNEAMRRAQTAWEAYRDECKANGKPEPRPFYAFKPTLIVPGEPTQLESAASTASGVQPASGKTQSPAIPMSCDSSAPGTVTNSPLQPGQTDEQTRT